MVYKGINNNNLIIDTDSSVLEFGHEKYKINLPEIGLYQIIKGNYKNTSDICSLVIKAEKYDFKITMEFRPIL